MNVLRLNFSHGSHEDKARVIADLRSTLNDIRASGQLDFEWVKGNVCGIAADTKGPEIARASSRAEAPTRQRARGRSNVNPDHK